MDDDIEIIIKRLENSKSIDSINLSNRQLKELPFKLNKIINQIKYLYLDNNKLIFVPEIGDFVQLEELSLESNELTLIPETFFKLKNLKSLNLSKNTLRCINSNLFTNLSNLTVLWLNNCELMFIPKEIGSLKYLEKLGFKSNYLQELPDEFCNLTKLRWLNMEKNEISKLPDNFHNLKSLNYLNISNNKLEKLDESLFELKELNILILAHNLINDFNEEYLLNLSSLDKVNLSANLFIEKIKKNKPDFYNQLLSINNFIFQG
jgi:leucine-rich repeat protein SHOC2